MPLPDVSVLIVNFNSGPWLSRCIASLQHSATPLEILVADNGSSDDSLARLAREVGTPPGLRIVENGRNLGFAGAVNALAALARAPFLLLLNPDCTVAPDTIGTTLRELRAAAGAGMAGCLVLNADGSEQRGCRRRLPTLRNALAREFGAGFDRKSAPGEAGAGRGFDLAGTPLPSATTDIEAISGAFMLVSRTAFDAVGPLDEGYFLHFEDLDWCARFHRAGYRIVFVPGARITHAQGACSRARPLRVEWHKHRGMYRFFDKFENPRRSRFLRLLIGAGVGLRFVVIGLRLLLAGAGLRR